MTGVPPGNGHATGLGDPLPPDPDPDPIVFGDWHPPATLGIKATGPLIDRGDQEVSRG